MATKHVLLTAPVTFNGAHIEAGEVIELGELSAQALIEEGKAKAAEPTAETKDALERPETPQEGEDADPHLTPSEDDEEPAEEELARMTKALNAKYTRDDLADEAKAVGVEFAFNAKKGEIIQAVIEADKADVLLQK